VQPQRIAQFLSPSWFLNTLLLLCFFYNLGKTQTNLESRNLLIPDLESSDSNSQTVDSVTLDLSRLRLHYRMGAYEKAAAHFFGRTASQAERERNYGYLGIEPISFSKPNQSIYQRPVGWWGGNLLDVVKDHRESYRIMKAYRTRAIVSDVLFVTGIVSGLITVGGIFADVPFWGKNETDLFGQRGDCLEWENGQRLTRCLKYESQVGYNMAITFTFLTSSIVPKLFNRGKIQKSVYIYNQQFKR